MRLVVTGREGQVVRSLVERGGLAGHDIVSLGRPDLDLSANQEKIFTALKEARPEVIVSAAAYTAVDRAEDEPDLAFAINSAGAGMVANAANRLGVPLVHLSTDYVFDGEKNEPYVESDATGPTGAYGASKLVGEEAVLAAHANVAILRTAWVYSPFGANFVKTILRLAAERDEISIVGDQRGNPSNALDIADGILAVASHLVENSNLRLRGVFHMSGGGDASWAEFAEAIIVASAKVGGPTARVKSISTDEYPTQAQRPANSRLAVDKLATLHDVRLPDWQVSLPHTVERLVRGAGLTRNKK